MEIIEKTNPVITFRQVSKRFGTRTIIHSMDLQVVGGEMIALTGSSGSGKSTLLNMIGLIETRSSGDFVLFGQPAPRPDSESAIRMIRQHIGYLFQNYALLPDESITNNLLLAMEYDKTSKRQKIYRMQEALEQVDIACPLKQKVYELSGGEQQRVAMARLLLKPCDLILADEPTGSLDEGNKNRIAGLLKTMNLQGRTIMIATHDPYIAGLCSRKILLSPLNPTTPEF